MRDHYIVHVTGSTPHAIDTWTKPYKAQHTAAGQAMRLLSYPHRITRPHDWRADIYRIDHEAFKDPTMTLVQVVQ